MKQEIKTSVVRMSKDEIRGVRRRLMEAIFSAWQWLQEIPAGAVSPELRQDWTNGFSQKGIMLFNFNALATKIQATLEVPFVPDVEIEYAVDWYNKLNKLFFTITGENLAQPLTFPPVGSCVKIELKSDAEVALVKENLQWLWNYHLEEVVQEGFEGLKRHVSAETDREIAAKAPKHKRKFGHEGNGLKGPKTKMMVRQLAIFNEFLSRHPVVEGHSRISRAHELWMKHPEWEKAATAKGEAKGYSSHKALAQAK